MLEMDQIQKRILEEVAELHDVPIGAYNLRASKTEQKSRASISLSSSAPAA